MIYLVHGAPYVLRRIDGALALVKSAMQFDLFGGAEEVPLTRKAKKRGVSPGQMSLFDMGSGETLAPLPAIAPALKPKRQVSQRKRAPKGGGYYKNQETGEVRFVKPGAFIPEDFDQSPVQTPTGTPGGLAVIQDDDSLSDLFLEADRIGSKYQTDEERRAFDENLGRELEQIGELIDQQFPDEGEAEVVRPVSRPTPPPPPSSLAGKDPTSKSAVAQRYKRMAEQLTNQGKPIPDSLRQAMERAGVAVPEQPEAVEAIAPAPEPVSSRVLIEQDVLTEPQKSKGHLGFLDGFEYFETPSGDIARAKIDDPIAVDGYRFGRFESTQAGWQSSPIKKRLDELQLATEAIAPAEPASEPVPTAEVAPFYGDYDPAKDPVETEAIDHPPTSGGWKSRTVGQYSFPEQNPDYWQGYLRQASSALRRGEPIDKALVQAGYSLSTYGYIFRQKPDGDKPAKRVVVHKGITPDALLDFAVQNADPDQIEGILVLGSKNEQMKAIGRVRSSGGREEQRRGRAFQALGAALHISREGQRITINGRTYELRNSRWHRVDEDERSVTEQAEATEDETQEAKWERLAETRPANQEEFERFKAELNAMSPEERREYFNWSRDRRNKAARSRSGKRGAETRKRRETEESARVEQLQATAEGRRLLEAEKNLASTTRGNTLLDPKKFDEYRDEVETAQAMLAVRNAFDNPTEKQQAYNDEQPEPDLNQGAAPTESWRVRGFSRVAGGVRLMAANATGIPWSIDWVDGKQRIIAGAKMQPDRSWNAERSITLYDTNGNNLLLFFPKGDHETSRRARRLIREIGEGKAQSMALDEMRAFIEGDEELARYRSDRQARQDSSDLNSIEWDEFLALKDISREGFKDLNEWMQLARYNQFFAWQANRDGERKTIDGRTYELRGGRWHRVDEDERSVTEQPEAIAPEPAIESTPEPDNWLNSLSDGDRERVFAEMNRLRSESDRYLSQSRETPGTIPVGGELTEKFARGEAIARFLGEIGKGASPWEAADVAKAEATLIFENWNKRREYQVHRYPKMLDSFLDDVARRFDRITAGETAEGRDRPPEPVTPASTVAPEALSDYDRMRRDHLRSTFNLHSDPEHWQRQIDEASQKLAAHQEATDGGLKRGFGGRLSVREEKRAKDDLKTSQLRLKQLQDWIDSDEPLIGPTWMGMSDRDKVISRHQELKEKYGTVAPVDEPEPITEPRRGQFQVDSLHLSYPGLEFRYTDDGQRVEVFQDDRLIMFASSAPRALMDMDDRLQADGFTRVDGPQEGDRINVNGRIYELRGGRWHRVDQEIESEAVEGVSVVEPEAIAETEPAASEVEPAATEIELEVPVEEPPPETKPSPTGNIGKPVNYEGISAFYKRLRDGNVTADEVRQMWQRYKDSKDYLRSELSQLSKDALLKQFFIYGGKQMKKAEIVDRGLGAIEGFFAPDAFNWSPFSETKEQAIDREVVKWTDEIIQQKAKERREKTEKVKKALSNPETLEEFQTFLEYRSIDKMTPEQRDRYETLTASKNKEERQAQAEVKAAVAPTMLPDGVKLELRQTRHAKKNIDLFVVTLSDRVEPTAFNTLRERCKKMGGWWSDYSKQGAIPGFQFTTPEAAEKFMSLEGTDGKQELEQKQTERQESAADRIQSQAEGIKQKAEEALNRDRLSNTARRARMAESAERQAMRDKQLAETMLAVAEGIRNGEVEFLDKFNTKAQFEQMETLLRRAQSDAAIARRREAEAAGAGTYRSSLDYDDEINKEVNGDHVRYAKYPYPNIHRENLKSIADAAQNVSGLKQLAQKMAYKVSLIINEPGAWQVAFRSPSEVEEYRTFMTRALEAAKKPGNPLSKEKWTIESNMDDLKDYDRLQRSDITNEAELRTALREYLEYRGKDGKVDPVKQMERKLIGLKIPGYFPTPKGLADRVVSTADITPGMRVLEPSAGKGSLVDAAMATGIDRKDITVIELSSTLADVLRAKNYEPMQQDFLEHTGEYDRIVMNPPFENGQDIDHVRHAYDLLAPGGKLVAITSEGPFFRSDKKATEFRTWLEVNGGYSEKLPEGSFLESDRSTGVNTRMVVLTKPTTLEKSVKFSLGGHLYRTVVTPTYGLALYKVA